MLRMDLGIAWEKDLGESLALWQNGGAQERLPWEKVAVMENSEVLILSALLSSGTQVHPLSGSEQRA